MVDFLRQLDMSIDWSRRNVFVTFFVGFATIGVTLGIYWYSSTQNELGTTIEPAAVDSGTRSEIRNPTVSFADVYLSPVALAVPSVFEMWIEVHSVDGVPVIDADFVLDFGRSEVVQCNYSPSVAMTRLTSDDKSYRRFVINELNDNERLYLRCLISSPVFYEILVQGGNLGTGRSLSFDQYQANQIREPQYF